MSKPVPLLARLSMNRIVAAMLLLMLISGCTEDGIPPAPPSGDLPGLTQDGGNKDSDIELPRLEASIPRPDTGPINPDEIDDAGVDDAE